MNGYERIQEFIRREGTLVVEYTTCIIFKVQNIEFCASKNVDPSILRLTLSYEVSDLSEAELFDICNHFNDEFIGVRFASKDDDIYIIKDMLVDDAISNDDIFEALEDMYRAYKSLTNSVER